MATGPNQTGSTLNSVSASLGYGSALSQQVSDEMEERRKKAERDAAANTGISPAPQLSSMLGY